MSLLLASGFDHMLTFLSLAEGAKGKIGIAFWEKVIEVDVE